MRLLEIVTPADALPALRETLAGTPSRGVWEDAIGDDLALVRVLMDTDRTEEVTDRLEARFAGRPGFRVIMLPVEATIPRIDDAAPAGDAGDLPARPPGWRPRIGREELRHDIAGATRLTVVFLVTAALSSLVAALGLLRGNVAVIIGAMVIAPLLGPNMALALATTLADQALGRRAVGVNLAGSGLAFAVALVVGLLLPVDVAEPELIARTWVGVGDIVLALASGIVGALAFTSGVSATLIGVMVAVALLPPLVTVALMVAAGEPRLAGGAALLLATNVICVNLAGVATFLVQGVRPRTWWEARKAKQAARRALAVWIVLLALLTTIIIVAAPSIEAPGSAVPAGVEERGGIEDDDVVAPP